MSELYFKECPTCAVKPGSPVLCESCLHNRRVISKLHELLKYNRENISIIERVIKI
jgi:hypothetical protein